MRVNRWLKQTIAGVGFAPHNFIAQLKQIKIRFARTLQTSSQIRYSFRRAIAQLLNELKKKTH